MKVLFDRRRFNVVLRDIRTTNIIDSSVLLCVFFFVEPKKSHHFWENINAAIMHCTSLLGRFGIVHLFIFSEHYSAKVV